MDILSNIIWFINSEPKTAINKNTHEKITKKEFETVLFDNSTSTNVKISLPLNDNLLFSITRELKRPVNVKQLLTLIYNFYKEPLKEEYINNAFEEMEEWKQDVIDYYNGDITKLTNYDVFTDICIPDFCGLELDEENGEYIVTIGPE